MTVQGISVTHTQTHWAVNCPHVSRNRFTRNEKLTLAKKQFERLAKQLKWEYGGLPVGPVDSWLEVL